MGFEKVLCINILSGKYSLGWFPFGAQNWFPVTMCVSHPKTIVVCGYPFMISLPPLTFLDGEPDSVQEISMFIVKHPPIF